MTILRFFATESATFATVLATFATIFDHFATESATFATEMGRQVHDHNFGSRQPNLT